MPRFNLRGAAYAPGVPLPDIKRYEVLHVLDEQMYKDDQLQPRERRSLHVLYTSVASICRVSEATVRRYHRARDYEVDGNGESADGSAQGRGRKATI